MTLLDQMLQRNPALVEAAIQLHQSGAIPPATQVIDLDAVAENGRVLAGSARRNNLRIYAMTKQNGLNPHMTEVLMRAGIPAVVGLEALQIHRIHRYGFPLGAVGHLQNIPRHQIRQVLQMRPEFMTVYTLEAARWVSEEAGRLGLTQRLYVRVTNPAVVPDSPVLGADDGAFGVLVGGWNEENCVAGIRPILDLPHVVVGGLMQFGGVAYGAASSAEEAGPTKAFLTMLRAKEKLERELGLRDLHLNTGGECNATTFDMLSRYGVTEVEPGMALTGSGSFHARQAMPEKPAQVVVTEMTHQWGDDIYTVGGVFAFVSYLYNAEPMAALAGRDLDEAKKRRLRYLYPQMVDGHGVFAADTGTPRIGDTIVMAHHPQAFLERGYTAAVSGISSGKPVVEGVFDAAANLLDGNFNPLPVDEAVEHVSALGRRYAS